jgi:hypothetical protein
MQHWLEIPKESWSNLLNIVNQHVLDHPVRLELMNQELGDQELGRLLPLREIDFEKKGSAQGALLISVGTDREELMHRIDRPTHFYVGHDEAGLVQYLAIEDEGGGKTLIYLEELPQIPAEFNDGPALA